MAYRRSLVRIVGLSVTSSGSRVTSLGGISTAGISTKYLSCIMRGSETLVISMTFCLLVSRKFDMTYQYVGQEGKVTE